MLLGANDGNTRRSGRDLDGRGRATNDHCAGGYAGCAVSAPASPMVLPGVVLSFFFSWQPAAANSKPAAMSAVRIRIVVVSYIAALKVYFEVHVAGPPPQPAEMLDSSSWKDTDSLLLSVTVTVLVRVRS